MKIECYLCKNELEELGALLFSPPYTEDETTLFIGKTDKFHLCKKCYVFIIDMIDKLRGFRTE